MSCLSYCFRFLRVLIVVVNEVGVLKVRTYKGGKLQAMFTQSPNYIYTNSTPGIIKYRSIRWTNLRAVGREITNRSCQSKCPTALFLLKRPLWQALCSGIGLCNFVQTTALREACCGWLSRVPILKTRIKECCRPGLSDILTIILT